MNVTGIILWLAIGAALVLFIEWRLSRYPGGREQLEIKAGWRVTPEFRAHQRIMIVVTWPYWSWLMLRHYVRLLLLWLGLLR